MAQDKYQLITDKLIALIEKGTPPWRQPWFIDKPRNLLTGKHYQGQNPLILQIQMMDQGHEDPYFIGYQQAKSQGWTIKKGCKASWILFAGFATKEIQTENGGTEEETYRVCQWHKVFNVACVDDGQDGKAIEKHKQNIWQYPGFKNQGNKLAQLIWEAADPKMQSYPSACYNPQNDTIYLPSKEKFITEDGYWATAMHELIHWTGHESRLNRSLNNGFNTHTYAYEELIAEIGSAYLCNEIELNPTLEDHASYLSGWLEILKDRKAFFKASKEAQKASDWILSIGFPEDEENLHGADETLASYIPNRL